MKVIITGSSFFTNYDKLNNIMNSINTNKKITQLISTNTKGVNQLGEKWAKANKIKIKTVPADWDKWGKSAGFKRNEMMISQADVVVAFWDGKTPTTQHLINTAKSNKLLLRIINI